MTDVIDWSARVNGWDVLFGALVQALTILATAALTWSLTRAAEARANRRLDEQRYRGEIDEYARRLYDTVRAVSRVVEQQHTDEDLADSMRFINGVVWKPKPADAVVDSWVRSRLIAAYIELSSSMASGDTEAKNTILGTLATTSTDYERWAAGALPTSRFSEQYSELPTKMPSPLAPALHARRRRLTSAIAAGFQAARSSWRGK